MSNGNNNGIKVLLILVILSLILSAGSLIFVAKMFMDSQDAGNKGGKPTVKISKKYDKKLTYAKAEASGKPIVAFFYVDWCGFCQRFAPLYSELTKDKELKKNVAFAYINCEDPKNADLVRKFNINSYPSVYVVKQDGTKTKLANGTFFNANSKEIVTNNILKSIK